MGREAPHLISLKLVPKYSNAHIGEANEREGTTKNERSADNYGSRIGLVGIVFKTVPEYYTAQINRTSERKGKN